MKLDKARKNFIGFVFFFYIDINRLSGGWVFPQNNPPSGAKDN